MAIPETMTTALVKQFNEELNSAYIYESMAADFHYKQLPGFASWMTIQASEERLHAEKIHRYLDENGERVFYAAIPEPQAEWASPIETLKAALDHEKYISRCIHKLVHIARKEDDIPTEVFLGWFVTEQVEEEASAQELIDKLVMIGDNQYGLYQLDKEVSTRQLEA